MNKFIFQQNQPFNRQNTKVTIFNFTTTFVFVLQHNYNKYTYLYTLYGIGLDIGANLRNDM